MPDTLDLRVVPPAVGAWVAALVVVRLSASWSASWGAAALLVALVACLDAARSDAGRRRAAGRERRRRWSGAAVLVLMVVGAVLLAGSAQVAARSAGPLVSLAAAGGRVDLTGVVTGEARPLATTWGEPRVRLVVTVDTVSVDGVRTHAHAPVLVLAPADVPLPFGARVAFGGRAGQTRPGSREIAVISVLGTPRVLEEASPWRTAAGGVRARVDALASALPGDAGVLLPGVTVGDTSTVPDELTQAMRDAGLTHLTAVSGAHFTLVAGLVLGLAGLVRLPRALRVLAALATGVGLVLLVHPTPSVLRAAAMGSVALLGMLVGRPARAPAALATTVVVLLVVDPWLASELGFVLSVLATAGLVLLGPVLVERWSGALGRPVAVALAAPVAAQLVCAPAVLVVQPSVSLVAVPANLVVAPAVAPATVLGLLAALVDPWWPAGGVLLSRLAGAACWWIGAVARWAADAPGARVPWLAGPVGVLLLVTATVAGTRLLLRPGR